MTRKTILLKIVKIEKIYNNFDNPYVDDYIFEIL